MSGSLTAEQLARGEALANLGPNGRTHAEQVELDALRDLAHSLTGPAEVADNPKTLFVDEARRPNLDGTDYLEEQKAQSARELEAWLSKAWASLWHALGPLVLQFGQAAIGAALAKVPHDVLIPGLVKLDLAPVVAAVEAAALDAAGAVVKDVTG